MDRFALGNAMCRLKKIQKKKKKDRAEKEALLAEKGIKIEDAAKVKNVLDETEDDTPNLFG